MDNQEKNNWDGFDLEDLTAHFSVLSAADEEEILSGGAEETLSPPEEWEGEESEGQSAVLPQEEEERSLEQLDWEDPAGEDPTAAEPYEDEPAQENGEQELPEQAEQEWPEEPHHGLRGLLRRVRHALEDEEEPGDSADEDAVQEIPRETDRQAEEQEERAEEAQEPDPDLSEEPYQRYDEAYERYIETPLEQEEEEQQEADPEELLPEEENAPLEEKAPLQEEPQEEPTGEEQAEPEPVSAEMVPQKRRALEKADPVRSEEEEAPMLLLAGAIESLKHLAARLKGQKPEKTDPAAEQTQSAGQTGAQQTSTMADVVASTVDGVLKDQEGVRRKYRRRRLRTQKEQEKLHRSNSDRAADTEDFSAPEPSMVEATMRQKRLEKRLRKHGTIAAVLTLCCWTATIFCPAGILQRYIPAALLGGVLIACAPVFAAGFTRKQINCYTLASVTGVVTLLDALIPISGRWEVPPMTGLAALCVTLALWGEAWRCGALREGFRLVALGRPAYVVDLTPHGAVKQEGNSAGFYNRSVLEDSASKQQRLVLPVVLIASLVFAVLSTVGQGQWGSFLWSWSVILCAGSGMALPLVYSLPGYRLAKRMGVSGGALAGLYGAGKLSFSREMLVWDQDLFPPGSIRMGKVAIIGEDRRKVASYAGSLARAYRCGWTPVFETFMQNERGIEEHLDHFHVHEEGGISASIYGETAVLGQAVLMRKMSVRLPKHLERKNALYLAIDGELTAIFPLEYRPADSVAWALYAMRRNRITPLLVTKDPNITPRNLKSMFGSDGGSVLLDLNQRLNLSALRSGGKARPNALLYREGLAPYLEAVVGSRRLCRAVKWGNVISLLGCAAGTLLSFYLIFVGKVGMLSPIQMLIFVLLWALPVVLMSLNVDRL